jgi:hypothetical protein
MGLDVKRRVFLKLSGSAAISGMGAEPTRLPTIPGHPGLASILTPATPSYSGENGND